MLTPLEDGQVARCARLSYVHRLQRHGTSEWKREITARPNSNQPPFLDVARLEPSRIAQGFLVAKLLCKALDMTLAETE